MRLRLIHFPGFYLFSISENVRYGYEDICPPAYDEIVSGLALKALNMNAIFDDIPL